MTTPNEAAADADAIVSPTSVLEAGKSPLASVFSAYTVAATRNATFYGFAGL